MAGLALLLALVLPMHLFFLLLLPSLSSLITPPVVHSKLARLYSSDQDLDRLVADDRIQSTWTSGGVSALPR
jgi:hypothetical protein